MLIIKFISTKQKHKQKNANFAQRNNYNDN
jgi:hypothetical protein